MVTKPEIVEQKPRITALECASEPSVPPDSALKQDTDTYRFLEEVRVAGADCRRRLHALKVLFYPETIEGGVSDDDRKKARDTLLN